MKKAVIVVGKHYSGKSRTLRDYLKPRLDMGNGRYFTRNGQSGCVLVQTCEEAEADVKDRVKKYSGSDYLVLAARPANESLSYQTELEAELKDAGYQVKTLHIVKPREESFADEYYGGMADEIIAYLDGQGAKAAGVS
ncbi:MAG TPA: hypothetical protein VKC61_03235 [Pyrinomonadaceae bacterium]|nr:hypothetical protein [Pyrinomonadaceae bacterium]